MTRKQALQGALEVLEHQAETEEIIEIREKIKELMMDIPLTHWTEETIFDTFAQFAIDNGRNATTTDMKKRGLPPHPVIKLRFGIEAKEFLDRYFPTELKCNSKVFGYKTKEEWLDLFIKEYERIRPSSAEEYNKCREENLPSWGSIARLYDITKWTELQCFCKLPIYTKGKKWKRVSTKLSLTRHTDLDDEIRNVIHRN